MSNIDAKPYDMHFVSHETAADLHARQEGDSGRRCRRHAFHDAVDRVVVRDGNGRQPEGGRMLNHLLRSVRAVGMAGM